MLFVKTLSFEEKISQLNGQTGPHCTVVEAI